MPGLGMCSRSGSKKPRQRFPTILGVEISIVHRFTSRGINDYDSVSNNRLTFGKKP